MREPAAERRGFEVRVIEVKIGEPVSLGRHDNQLGAGVQQVADLLNQRKMAQVDGTLRGGMLESQVLCSLAA